MSVMRSLPALICLLLASPAPAEDSVLPSGDWSLWTDQAPTAQKHVNVKITLEAEADVTGWPDERKERPHMVIECERGKLRAYIATKLIPEVYGDYYDDYLAMARIGFNDGSPDEWRMRRSVGGKQLHFPKAKIIVKELLVHESMFFEFTPFSSPPTSTTFNISGFRQAVLPLKDSCKIQTEP